MPFVQGQQISTHTLRVEGDCPLPSTTSTRWTSFYPRPPHGGRHETAGWRSSMCTISIHALRMEGDISSPHVSGRQKNFYPRPRVEGDWTLSPGAVLQGNFYPRPPHVGRHMPFFHGIRVTEFLPTPSHGGRRRQRSCERRWYSISTHALTWRATQCRFSRRLHGLISTHALTWRATKLPIFSAAVAALFLPTPSHGGRPQRPAHRTQPAHFYPRPRVEGDSCNPAHQNRFCISIHALA